jgi:hypothetical protein
MQSKLNNALHPAVDPSDKYDPTFIGVTRKRRAPPPVSGFLKEERGKQIDVEQKKHGEYLVQLPEMYQPETFKGDTRSTRFGVGFNRRPMSLIGSDLPRRTQQEKNEREAEIRLDHKREYHFERTRSRPANPITGEIPKALALAASHVQRHEPEIHTGKAMSPERWRDNVDFSWDEKRRKAAPPPDQRTYTNRQQRLMNEGLPAGTKDWSVAQQLSCGDGYESVTNPKRVGGAKTLPKLHLPWSTTD